MRRFVPALACAALLLTSLPSTATSRTQEVAPAGGADVSTGSFDIRTSTHRAPLAEALRAEQTLRAEVADARVTWDRSLGTAKLVYSANGYLSGTANGSAVAVARGWASAHRGLFGVTPSLVARAKVTRDAALPGTEMHAVVLRLVYGSIPTFGGGAIGVNVMPDGRVVTAWANTGPAGAVARDPKIDAATALRVVARRVGATSLKIKSLGQRRSGDRLSIFNAGGLYQNHNVRLVVFPTGHGPLLGWRVFLAKAGEEMISSIVDARTGAILFLNNEVVHAEGKVYQNHPGAKKGGTQEVVSFDGDPTASPLGWLGIPLPSGGTTPGITTLGNNAFAFTDWMWPKLAPGLLLLKLIQANTFPDYMPISPTGSFDYDYANNWAKSCTPTVTPKIAGHGIPVKGNTIENPSFVQDRDPSVTNLFFFANRYHDLMYRLGFTEPMGNYQQDNFGKGGIGMDAVRVGSMLGIMNNQVDNAFFFPAPDGGEPTSFIDPADPTKIGNYLVAFSGMFLWRPVPGFLSPCADGSTDSHVVWHELTHGVTTRVAGGPDDSDSLTQTQSGAMGEAWSDWFAMHFLHQLGLEDSGVFGPYVTGNPTTGIRHFRLDANPLTYADMGFGRHGPEVHDDGEIWSGTLWDLREALIAKHGEKEGADRAGHVVFDALTLAGMANPSFLDQRNGILKADLARYKGEDTALLWRVFARRGMGASAKTLDAQDAHPIPGFDAPGSSNGTLSGVVTDADGGVLKGMKILLGLGEGQPNPSTRTDADGKFSISLEPGTYNLTIGGAGYGLQPQGAVTIGTGTLTKSVALLKNLSSLGYGAKVVSGLVEGDLGLSLIDDHEFSGQSVLVGQPVVVKLVGTAPVLVRSVEVATKPSGAGGDAAASAYKVELSIDGKKWVQVATGGVKGVVPRPTTAQWKRQTKKLGSAIAARFARITVTDTVGEKPAAPENVGPAPTVPDWTAVLGDLQVLGNAPGAIAQKIGGEPDFVEQATIALSNAGGGGGGADASATELLWQTPCQKPPDPIQGLDAWITELPDGYGDGLHQFAIKNSGGQATDIDVYFWNADCTEQVGQIASPLANEAGPIPPKAKWALIVLFAGTTDGFEVRASTTIERVQAPIRVLGEKQTRPAPASRGSHLPATGVRDTAALGAVVMALALASRRWLRRSA